MYYIYILRCDDGSLYTGITNNLKKRISEHYYRKKQCARYTKSHKVVGVEAVFCAEDKSGALKCEQKIKKLSKQDKENMIISFGDFEDFVRLEGVRTEDYI